MEKKSQEVRGEAGPPTFFFTFALSCASHALGNETTATQASQEMTLKL